MLFRSNDGKLYPAAFYRPRPGDDEQLVALMEPLGSTARIEVDVPGGKRRLTVPAVEVRIPPVWRWENYIQAVTYKSKELGYIPFLRYGRNTLYIAILSVLGTVIAIVGVPLLVSLANRYTARANEIHLDAPVLAFTLALSVVTALFLSFVTAVPSERQVATVTSGGRRSSAGRRRQRLQRALVVVQVAVSMVLLAGAGLLTRTLLRVGDVRTGLQSEEVLTMEIRGLAGSVDTQRDTAAATTARNLFAQIREEVAALPGVEAVATGSIPLRGGFRSMDVKVENRPLHSEIGRAHV